MLITKTDSIKEQIEPTHLQVLTNKLGQIRLTKNDSFTDQIFKIVKSDKDDDFLFDSSERERDRDFSLCCEREPRKRKKFFLRNGEKKKEKLHRRSN